MAFGAGAGRRNREIFSRGPTPLQLGAGMFILLLLLAYFVATNKNNVSIEGKAIETIEDTGSAPAGDDLDEEKVQQERQEEPEEDQDTARASSDEPEEQEEAPEAPKPLLIGDEVELEEDSYPYTGQCNQAISSIKEDITAKKQVVTEADAVFEEAAKKYERAKQNMDTAKEELSGQRQKLLDVKQSCQATGEPYGE